MKIDPMPRRRVVLSIEIGADTWEEAIGSLDQIALDMRLDFDRHGLPEGHVDRVSGGPSRGWVVRGDEDKSITHESYFATIAALKEES